MSSGVTAAVPNHAWVMGRRYRIQPDQNGCPKQSCQGFCDDFRGVIYISPKVVGDARRELLLHELLHACDHATYRRVVDSSRDPRFAHGYCLAESTVCLLSASLFTLLNDPRNAALVRYLTEGLGTGSGSLCGNGTVGKEGLPQAVCGSTDAPATIGNTAQNRASDQSEPLPGT